MRVRIEALYHEVDTLAATAGTVTGNRTVRKNLRRASNALLGALRSLDAQLETLDGH